MKTALVLLLSALLFLQSVNGAVKGLNANVSTLCTSGCLWSDATIWTDGVVPTSADNVDIQASGSYIIRLDVDANVTDFDIGVDSYGSTHNFEILAGVTLRSTGQMVAKLTSKVTVFAGASLIITGQATHQGLFVIYGSASFGGSSPSLQINTRDVQIQLPTHIVYATLELYNGTITVANNLAISAASEFYGSGSIVGTVQLRGELYPGGKDTVGTITISGDLSMESTAETTIDISDATTFDHVIIGQNSIERGDLYANLLGDYEPLSHSEFVCFNHSSLRNGFETVRGTSLLERISSKWQTIPDQEYTSLLYDDATTVLISFATIALCLLISL